MTARTGARPAAPVRGTTTLSPGSRPAWPGIREPACHDCTWAWRYESGRMEVKYVNRLCRQHGHTLGGTHA